MNIRPAQRQPRHYSRLGLISENTRHLASSNDWCKCCALAPSLQTTTFCVLLCTEIIFSNCGCTTFCTSVSEPWVGASVSSVCQSICFIVVCCHLSFTHTHTRTHARTHTLTHIEFFKIVFCIVSAETYNYLWATRTATIKINLQSTRPKVCSSCWTCRGPFFRRRGRHHPAGLINCSFPPCSEGRNDRLKRGNRWILCGLVDWKEKWEHWCPPEHSRLCSTHSPGAPATRPPPWKQLPSTWSTVRHCWALLLSVCSNMLWSRNHCNSWLKHITPGLRI